MNAINIKQTLITAFWSVSFLLPCIYLPAQQKPGDAVSDTTLFQETFRPQYHLTPVRGWVNDPTALVYVDGLYQVNKRLAVSNDLIHWQREDHPHNFNKKDSVGEMS